MDLRDITTKRHLQSALDEIGTVGRYWPGAITRGEAAVLEELVKEHGHIVLGHDLSPEWEHVIALLDCSLDELRVIASRQAELREQGLAEAKLPK